MGAAELTITEAVAANHFENPLHKDTWKGRARGAG
jgi:hypothetical protein